jgi:hypothetical protein
MGILSSPTHQDYGSRLVNPSGSTSMWMILALNILEENTYNTFIMHYKKEIYDIVEDLKVDLYCGISLWKNSQNTITLHLWNRSTARICQIPSSTARTTKHPNP